MDLDLGKAVRGRRERGATMMEFAIISPVLLLLLFGAIELARLGFAFSEVWSAAREGARYATVFGDSDSDGAPNYIDCDAIEDAALAKITVESVDGGDVDVFWMAGATVVADCQGGGAPPPSATGAIDSGIEIRVEVTSTFNAVVPILDSFFDGIALDSTQNRTINYGTLP